MKTKTAGMAPFRLTGWFTIWELIVVIAILAILATVGLLALQGYASDAREAAARSNARSVFSAISSESAATGNSPRYYVVHDPAVALTGTAVSYVQGDFVTLTGGNWDQDGTNYSAGNPDWTKLKINPEKFGDSGATTIVAGTLDVHTLTTPSRRKRAASFSQVAVLLPDDRTAVVTGNYPAPSIQESASGAVGGLIRDRSSPDPADALVDGSRGSGSTPSEPPAPGSGGTPAAPGAITIGNSFNFSWFPSRLNFTRDADATSFMKHGSAPFVFHANFSVTGLDPGKTYNMYVGDESCSQWNMGFYYENPSGITGVTEYSASIPIEVYLGSGYAWDYLTDAATTHQCDVLVEFYDEDENADPEDPAAYASIVVPGPEFELVDFRVAERNMWFMSWEPYNFWYTEYSSFGYINFRHEPNAQYTFRFLEDPSNPCQKDGVTCVLPWDATFTTDGSGVYDGNVFEWSTAWSISYPQFFGSRRYFPFGGEFQIIDSEGRVVASHVTEMDLNFSEPY